MGPHQGKPMSEAAAYEPDAGVAPELRLAECWADVTKALALYPDSNDRVRLTLEQMLEALAATFTRHHAESGVDPERGIALLFQEDRVIVGSFEHAFDPSSTLAWLRARLDRSALAGVELMADLDAESFTAFTRRLLGNFLSKESEPTFEALWPELHPGVVLIDRRFDGTFGGLPGMGAFAGGHGGSAGGEARHFITGLLTHPKVRTRLERLRDEVEAADDETEEASSLLREVLEDVPADALKSRNALIDWVCGRLDDLAGRVVAGADAQQREGARFAKLLHNVSQQHFVRQGPNLDRIKTGAIVESKPGGGRARDASIADDIESLTAEVQRLPAQLTMQLGEGDEAAIPEQIAVALHYAIHLDRPEDLPGQTSLLDQLLENPGPQELAVLRKYLLVDDEGESAAIEERTAVIRVLERAGRTRLLRACGALSPEVVVDVFPEHFGHYLSVLDFELEHDRAEFDEVLRGIGSKRLLDAGRRILPAIEALDRDQVQRLLEQPDACRLGLARMLLHGGDRDTMVAAATFLQELNLPETEAFLLTTIRPPALLTSEYLMGLIDLHLGRTSSFAMRTPVSEVLCRHITAVGDADPLDRARMESIRLLARYPSTRGEQMLRTLKRFRFGPFGGTQPPPVRKLARSLLKHWKTA